MKFRLFFPVAFLLLVFTVTQGMAAETTTHPATDREKALEEKVHQLENQLEDANKTIADLQNQLRFLGMMLLSPGPQKPCWPMVLFQRSREKRPRLRSPGKTISRFPLRSPALGRKS